MDPANDTFAYKFPSSLPGTNLPCRAIADSKNDFLNAGHELFINL
jgi:hypothetical protein